MKSYCESRKEKVMNDEVKVSNDDFRRYEAVRQSGVTNMFDVRYVCELSGLTRKQVLYIMNHYGDLYERTFGKRR